MSTYDHCIRHADYWLIPFEELPLVIAGVAIDRCHVAGAARLYDSGSIEIELGEPPFNGVDHGGRFELPTERGFGNPALKHLSALVERAFRVEHAHVIDMLIGRIAA